MIVWAILTTITSATVTVFIYYANLSRPASAGGPVGLVVAEACWLVTAICWVSWGLS